MQAREMEVQAREMETQTLELEGAWRRLGEVWVTSMYNSIAWMQSHPRADVWTLNRVSRVVAANDASGSGRPPKGREDRWVAKMWTPSPTLWAGAVETKSVQEP